LRYFGSEESGKEWYDQWHGFTLWWVVVHPHPTRETHLIVPGMNKP